jgi:hypothetical protein
MSGASPVWQVHDLHCLQCAFTLQVTHTLRHGTPISFDLPNTRRASYTPTYAKLIQFSALVIVIAKMARTMFIAPHVRLDPRLDSFVSIHPS